MVIGDDLSGGSRLDSMLQGLRAQTGVSQEQPAAEPIRAPSRGEEILRRTQEYYRTRKTAGTALRETLQRPQQLVPYGGAMSDAALSGRVWAVGRKLESGQELEPDEEKFLTSFVADAQRPQTLGYMATKIVMQLPALMGEFLTSGGAASAGRIVGQGGARALMGKAMREAAESAARTETLRDVALREGRGLLAQRLAQRLATQRAAVPLTARAMQGVGGFVGAAAGRVAQFGAVDALLGGGRISATAYQRAMPELGLTVDEQGELGVAVFGAGREFLEALPEAVLDQFIEVGSEMSGGLLNKLPLIDRARAAAGKVAASWIARNNPSGNKAKAFLAALDKVGWNGMVTEYLEERIGATARAATGLGEFEDIWPGLKQTAAELIAFSVPGGTALAASGAAGAVRSRIDKGLEQRPAGQRYAPEAAQAKELGALPKKDRDRAISQWARASGVQGVRELRDEELSPQQQDAVDLGRVLGSRVVVVTGANISQSRNRATMRSEGFIVMSAADATPESLLWHEVGHVARRRSPEAWDAMRARLQERAPEFLAAAEREWESRYRQANAVPDSGPQSNIDADLRMEEGVSQGMDWLGPVLSYGMTPQGRGDLQRVLAEEPGFLTRVKEAVVDVIARLVGARGAQTRRGAVARLRDILAESEAVDIDVQRAAQSALDILDTLESIEQGRAPGSNMGFERQGPVQQPQSREQEKAERRLRQERFRAMREAERRARPAEEAAALGLGPDEGSAILDMDVEEAIRAAQERRRVQAAQQRMEAQRAEQQARPRPPKQRRARGERTRRVVEDTDDQADDGSRNAPQSWRAYDKRGRPITAEAGTPEADFAEAVYDEGYDGAMRLFYAGQQRAEARGDASALDYYTRALEFMERMQPNSDTEPLEAGAGDDDGSRNAPARVSDFEQGVAQTRDVPEEELRAVAPYRAPRLQLFSPLHRWLTDLKQDTFTVAQLKALVQRNAKAEELKWLDLDAFFAEQAKGGDPERARVEKADLLKYLNAHLFRLPVQNSFREKPSEDPDTEGSWGGRRRVQNPNYQEPDDTRSLVVSYTRGAPLFGEPDRVVTERETFLWDSYLQRKGDDYGADGLPTPEDDGILRAFGVEVDLNEVTIGELPAALERAMRARGRLNVSARWEDPVPGVAAEPQYIDEYILQFDTDYGTQTLSTGYTLSGSEEAGWTLYDDRDEELTSWDPGYSFNDIEHAAWDRAEDSHNEYLDANPPDVVEDVVRYEQYTTPGGEQYKEHLLLVPEEVGLSRGISQHFSNDTLAWARSKVRKLQKAGRALFLEEVQSDWHQGRAGAEGTGYRNPAVTLGTRQARAARLSQAASARIDLHTTIRAIGRALAAPEGAMRTAQGASVAREAPDALRPFSSQPETNAARVVLLAERDPEALKAWLNRVDSGGWSAIETAGIKNTPLSASAVQSEARRMAQALRLHSSQHAFVSGTPWRRYETAQKVRRRAFMKYAEKRPDKAPFESTWHEIVFKHMLLHAVSEGLPNIAWTRGAEQLRRYESGLRTRIKRIEWHPAAERGETQVSVTPQLARLPLALTVDSAGVVVESLDAVETEGQTLRQVLGKELAEQILGSPGGAIEGENISIGGFHNVLYDTKLRQVAERIGKRYGIKVEGDVLADVAPGYASPEDLAVMREVWVMPITPDLARDIEGAGGLARHAPRRPSELARAAVGPPPLIRDLDNLAATKALGEDDDKRRRRRRAQGAGEDEQRGAPGVGEDERRAQGGVQINKLPDGRWEVVGPTGRVVRVNKGAAEQTARWMESKKKVRPLIDDELRAILEDVGVDSVVQRKPRRMLNPKKVQLSEAEQAFVEANRALMPNVEDVLRDAIARFPESQGWVRPEPARVKVDEDTKKVKLEFRKPGYGFADNPKTGRVFMRWPKQAAARQAEIERLGDLMIRDVRATVRRARKGDADARVALRNAQWYSNMVDVLRNVYGGSADIMVDLLGALSPNTPVETNWLFAVDFLDRLSRGEFDRAIEVYASYVGTENAVSRFREEHPGLVPRQANGKLYGFNSMNALHAAYLSVWRQKQPGSAPKAKNFSWNFTRFSDDATIDVWAARYIARLAGRRRLPPPSEGGVGGEWDSNAEYVTNEFGFAQEVMQYAADRLGVPAKDLQALVWFNEKAFWTAKGYTSAQGEDGSVEAEDEKAQLSRMFVGVTPAMNVATQGVDYVPTPEDLRRITSPLMRELHAEQSVVSARVANSVGRYMASEGETIEKSLDFEFVTAPGYDPAALEREVKRLAKKYKQQSAFMSRVLRHDEELSDDARPALEVFFERPLSMEEVERFIKQIRAKGLDGFTLVRAHQVRATRAELLDDPDAFVGMRLQAIHEFHVPNQFRAGGKDEGAPDLEAFHRWWEDQSQKLVDELALDPDVSYAGRQRVKTVVFFEESYEDTSGRASRGALARNRPRQRGRSGGSDAAPADPGVRDGGGERVSERDVLRGDRPDRAAGEAQEARADLTDDGSRNAPALPPAVRVRARAAMLATRQMFQDRTIRLRDLLDQNGIGTGTGEDADLHGALDLAVSQSGAAQEAFTERVLRALAPFRGKDLDLVQRVAAAHSAPQRNAWMLAERGVVNAAGISDADARQVEAAARAALGSQRVDRFLDEIRAANREHLDLLVQAQILTRDVADKWHQREPHYLSLRDMAEELEGEMTGFQPAGRSAAVRGPLFRKAEGRIDLAGDALLAWHTSKLAQIDAAYKNKALAEQGVALAGEFAGQPDPPVRVITKAQHVGPKEPEGGVAFFLNGQRAWLQFENTDIADALKGLGAKQVGWALGALGKVTRVFSRGVTARNPFFWPRNFLRDTVGAAFNIVAGEGRSAADAARVLAAAWRDLPELIRHTLGRRTALSARIERAQRAGFKTTWAQRDAKDLQAAMQDALATERTFGQRARRFLRALDSMSDAFEQATRLAAFEYELERTGSERQAALYAKRITVNFDMRGEATAAMSSVFAFFNPAVQGATRLLEAMTSPRGAKLTAGLVAVGLLTEILGFALGDDDERTGVSSFAGVSEFERSRSLVAPFDVDGVRPKFLLPYGLASIFASGRRLAHIASHMQGAPLDPGYSPTQAAFDTVAQLLREWVPVDTTGGVAGVATPTILSPFIDIQHNVTFTGAPLMPEASTFGRTLPDSARYFSTLEDTFSGIVSKHIADVLNLGGSERLPTGLDVSPESVQRVLAEVMAYVGLGLSEADRASQFVLSKRPATVVWTPMLRDLVTEQTDYYISERFYELRDRASMLKSAAAEGKDGLREARATDPVLWRQIESLERAHRSTGDLRRKIREATTRAERRALRDRLTAVQARALRRYYAALEG